jgi:hypothetical protein
MAEFISYFSFLPRIKFWYGWKMKSPETATAHSAKRQPVQKLPVIVNKLSPGLEHLKVIFFTFSV